MSLQKSTAQSPNGVALDISDTTNNFSMIINGGTCYGYKLFITDTDNATQLSTSAVVLDTPIYDTESLSIDLDISSLSTGETYLWYAYLYSKAATATMTIASPCIVTWTGHGLSDDDTIQFNTTGALPTGLSVSTIYYLVNSTTDTFQVAATQGGTAINTSGTQSGTHTAMSTVDYVTDTAYLFYSDDVPVLSYLPVPSGTSPLYYNVDGSILSIRGTYTQAQDAPISSWYFTIYDSLQQAIESYTVYHNQNINYALSGLITDTVYYINFTVTTEHGFAQSSEKVKLVVDYDDLPALISLTATMSSVTSGVTITWGGFIYLLGEATGAAPTYIADFLESGNYAVQPVSDIDVIDFQSDATINFQFVWANTATTVDGSIAELLNLNSGETLDVQYNNSSAQLELYYTGILIDSISYATPTASTGSRIIFVTATSSLNSATLKIVEGV